MQPLHARGSEAHLEQPPVPGGALLGELSGRDKMKLREQGVRSIFAVEGDCPIVTVLAVDRREKLAAYEAVIGQMAAAARLPAASRKA